MKTNVTETSLDAYYNHVAGQVQSKFHEAIGNYMIMQMRPLTRREIGQALKLDSNQYSARCNELIAAKVMMVVGEKKCSISGRNVEALMHSANVVKS